MSLTLRDLPTGVLSRTMLATSPLPRVAYALTLDPGQKYGSMEEQIVLLAERFRDEGSLFAPVFICNPSADASQFRSRGIDTLCLDLRKFSWTTIFQLRSFIRSRRIGIVHWNFVAPIANPYVWGLSALTPFVRHWFTDHNSRVFPLNPPPRGLARMVKRSLLRRYGKVIGVSRYVEKCLTDHDVWSNLVSELHFINTDRFCPDEAERSRMRHSMGVNRHFVLLTVGHLIPEKGIDVAIRAVAELPANVVLWIVGKGPEEESLRKLVAELNLSDRVYMLGQQRQVQPFFQSADCFVCPSRWAEAAGLVNLEAQASGCPVIASRIGGIPEYVADGQTGLLFEPNDHRNLARCVLSLCETPQQRLTFSRAAREHVVDGFSQIGRLNGWIELYRQWRN